MVSCDVTNAILEKSVKFELKVVEIIILWISRQLLNNNNNNNNNNNKINYMLQNFKNWSIWSNFTKILNFVNTFGILIKLR